MYAGALDVFGKPRGRRIVYRIESGECDVGEFDNEADCARAGRMAVRRLLPRWAEGACHP